MISIGYIRERNRPYQQFIRPSATVGVDIRIAQRLSLHPMGEIEMKNKEPISWTPEKVDRTQLFAEGLIQV